jgi:hypothetical protein
MRNSYRSAFEVKRFQRDESPEAQPETRSAMTASVLEIRILCDRGKR